MSLESQVALDGLREVLARQSSRTGRARQSCWPGLAVAVAGKLAGAYLGARASRMNRWESLGVGAGLNARGVIEIIIATVGVRLGVLNTASYTVVVLVAVITSLMAPPLLRYAVARLEETDAERLRLARIYGPAAGAAMPLTQGEEISRE